jgi:ribosomal protein L35AE/L33A
MYQLHIEHIVPDFDNWKRAFDSDPVNRKKMGVRNYRILRPVDNPNYVIIDLDFDSAQNAEALLAAMREVWKEVEGKIMMNPIVRISEIVQNTPI